MANPYAAKGAAQFWRTAVAELDPDDVSPIPHKTFQISAQDLIATAGSCFAQHVSRHIEALRSVRFLQTEASPPDQPVFSARFGNIYTAAQLLQLLLEAQGRLRPPPLALRRPDGRFVDAFRPTVFAEGFDNPQDVAVSRETHLAAVRRMFAQGSVFVFTLGLTEGWATAQGGFALPIHPGVISDDAQPQASFRRYSFEDVKADLERFLAEFAAINPAARVILTVSPVPLTATFTDEHVLSATTYSKSVLRAVCGSLEAAKESVFYFPSYEIISNPYNAGAYYESNKRTVTAAGVAHVMRVFDRAYLDRPATPGSSSDMLDASFRGKVVCDEEKYGTNIGF